MKTRRPRKPKPPPTVTPPQAGPGLQRWWWHLVIVLGLMLANLWLYRSVPGLDFLSVDDGDYVLNNPHIENFSAANLKFIFTQPYSANYAPANLLSYSLDVALAGGRKSAFAIHLSNVLWHGFVVGTVYLLAYTMRRRILLATAAALLFLLHPTHVEVVAWISSRKDLVATGFAALSMAGYFLNRWASRGRGWWYAFSVFCFLLASAGKQSVILLPGVMLVWDILVEKRRDWRMFAEKVPFGLITVFFGWMTWHAQPSTNLSPHAFVLAGTELTNLWLLTGLGDYVLYRGAPVAAAWSAAARAGIIAAAVLVWFLPLLFVWARKPIRAGLGYWILLSMIPPMVLSFVVPITDRYLFLPSVGVCLLLADIGVGWAQRRPRARWLGYGLLVALGIVWGAKTSNYLAEWRDPRSVWYGAHFKTKNPEVAQFLGEVYHNAGDRVNNFVKSGTALAATNELALAQVVLTNALHVRQLQTEWLTPGAARTNSTAYRDQLWQLAWEQYEAALANRGTISTPNLFMNRGRLLVSEGKFTRAITEFENALRFAQVSNYPTVRLGTATHALYAIGVAHWNLRQYRQAEQWLLKAQELQRKSDEVWIGELDQQVERIKTLAAHKP